MQSPARLLVAIAPSFLVLFAAGVARSETIQAPVGGKSFALSDGRVPCAAPSAGFTLDADGKLKPPVGDDAVGKATSVRVGASTAACATQSTEVTLVATGKSPTVDQAASALAVDDARVDVRGRGLRGAIVVWRAGGKTGEDRCVTPTPDGAAEKCALAVARGLPADPAGVSLEVWPAGARTGAGVTTYDANGRVIDRDELALRPGKITVGALLAPDASIDLAGGGVSRVTLLHPEAVTSAECGAADCEVAGNALLVRRVAGVAAQVPVRLRLVPRVFLQRGDALDPSPTLQVPVLPCTMTVASGDALRGVDDSRLVVRLDARCAADAKNMHFTVNGHAADVARVAADGAAALVVLRAGRIDSDDVAIMASRGAADLAVIGAAHAHARAIMPPRAAIELPDHGPIDFIPTNRSAVVRFADVPGAATFVLVPVEGVYDVGADSSGATTIIGRRSAAGFVALRFAYRYPSLPGDLATTDLATLVEPIERPMHEANVPVSIGASTMSKTPFAELVCDEGGGGARTVKPGGVAHVPFIARDGCRIVLHRERLSPEDGAQNLSIDIDVTSAGGSSRPEAHLSQSMVIRAAKDPRYLWIKGVQAPFDRITVRLSHSADESHYVGGAEVKTGTPSAQWSVIAGTGVARLYATTAIPTGLYRVSDADHSGVLTLNFGIITRLTWLDTEGHEGFVGLEAGVMGEGLAYDKDASGHSLTQVATVTGFGLSVPIANRSTPTETSINLHAWFEYEVSRAVSGQPGSPLGFVFGPSISIGNVGTNL